jgi:hypothetical protein
MVLEETKAAGPEDDGDTEEEEEEDNPQDDDSVGHRKLVIVDQLPTPPHDSRAQGEIEKGACLCPGWLSWSGEWLKPSPWTAY